MLSFATLALTVTCDSAVCVVAVMVEGGACVNEMAGAGEPMTTTAVAGLDGVVPAEAAVMVTEPHGGIVLGGVYIVAALFVVCGFEKEP